MQRTFSLRKLGPSFLGVLLILLVFATVSLYGGFEDRSEQSERTGGILCSGVVLSSEFTLPPSLQFGVRTLTFEPRFTQSDRNHPERLPKRLLIQSSNQVKNHVTFLFGQESTRFNNHPLLSSSVESLSHAIPLRPVFSLESDPNTDPPPIENMPRKYFLPAQPVPQPSTSYVFVLPRQLPDVDRSAAPPPTSSYHLRFNGGVRTTDIAESAPQSKDLPRIPAKTRNSTDLGELVFPSTDVYTKVATQKLRLNATLGATLISETATDHASSFGMWTRYFRTDSNSPWTVSTFVPILDAHGAHRAKDPRRRVIGRGMPSANRLNIDANSKVPFTTATAPDPQGQLVFLGLNFERPDQYVPGIYVIFDQPTSLPYAEELSICTLDEFVRRANTLLAANQPQEIPPIWALIVIPHPDENANQQMATGAADELRRIQAPTPENPK